MPFETYVDVRSVCSLPASLTMEGEEHGAAPPTCDIRPRPTISSYGLNPAMPTSASRYLLLLLLVSTRLSTAPASRRLSKSAEAGVDRPISLSSDALAYLWI